MPLIAHSNLPTFKRLKADGETILSKNRADNQSIRELHIGLLNIMPDAALQVTERQFFRLVGHSNQIAQFYLHPFTIPAIKRNNTTQKYIFDYYESFDEVKNRGLDALIITGAQVDELKNPTMITELKAVFDWAYDNITSTMCSCLATHAVLDFHFGQVRKPMPHKCWGVFEHKVLERQHPLMRGVNTNFDVPHSRFNEISRSQFEQSEIKILVDSEVGAHLCVSEDLFRIVFLQGHPEYDTISLLKEFKREVVAFLDGERDDYPDFPDNYLGPQNQAILNEFKQKLLIGGKITDFPESLIQKTLNNTWGDTTATIINNWIGCVYQITHQDLKKPFMDHINPKNPLNIK